MAGPEGGPQLLEFGTAQRIMGVYRLEPGESDTKERWEQAPPTYEEQRKADPSLLTPIRPAPGFAAIHEGLAAEAAIEGETAALPAEAASGAGFGDVRLVELHGRVTEGDRVLRGSRAPA